VHEHTKQNFLQAVLSDIQLKLELFGYKLAGFLLRLATSDSLPK